MGSKEQQQKDLDFVMGKLKDLEHLSAEKIQQFTKTAGNATLILSLSQLMSTTEMMDVPKPDVIIEGTNALDFSKKKMEEYLQHTIDVATNEIKFMTVFHDEIKKGIIEVQNQIDAMNGNLVQA